VLLIGFCFCGVYVTAEKLAEPKISPPPTETRGQALSDGMMWVQSRRHHDRTGPAAGRDPGGFHPVRDPRRCIVSSRLRAILLSVHADTCFGNDQTHESARTVQDLARWAVWGWFLLGGCLPRNSAWRRFTGARTGLSLAEISIVS